MLRENVYLCVLVPLSTLVLLAVPRSEVILPFLFPLLILSIYSETNAPSRLLGSRLVHTLGVLSYSIYLVHDLLTGLIGWVHADATRHHLAHGQTYGALLGIVLTPPLSWMAYKCIEHPGREWLRSLLAPAEKVPRSETPVLDSEQIVAG